MSVLLVALGTFHLKVDGTFPVHSQRVVNYTRTFVSHLGEAVIIFQWNKSFIVATSLLR